MSLGLRALSFRGFGARALDSLAGCTARHVGGCQNSGPFLSPQYNTAPTI